MSQCTYRCVVLPDQAEARAAQVQTEASQCTYRCVVLPDGIAPPRDQCPILVSMHLQVRGAP